MRTAARTGREDSSPSLNEGDAMRLRVLFGLTILLGSLPACATGSTFGGTGGTGEGGSAGGGEGGNTSTTSPAGGGDTTGTATTTDTSTVTGVTTTTTTPPCEESPCKLVAPQCGCEGDEMCAVNTSGTRVCRAPGDVAVGEVCVGLFSCVAGAICVQTAGSKSLCTPYCDTDAQCDGAAICLLELTDPQNPGQVLPGVKLCTDDCNPITNQGCPSGQNLGCQIYNNPEEMVTFTLCATAGTVGQNQPCTTTDDCAPGHSCFTLDGGSKECLQFCNVDNPSCALCVTVNPPLIYNGVNYGACL